MPNRIIREAILTSERVNSLDWPAEIFYRRLMSIVDDYGRHEFSEKLLRSKLYPLKVDTVREADISRWIAACVKAGLIVLYEGAPSKRFLIVLDFGQQTRTPSKCPEPPSGLLEIDNKRNQMLSNDTLVGGVSEGVVEREKESACASVAIPPKSRKEFDEIAKSQGIFPDCAEWVWNTYEARGWLDKGQPVTNVGAILRRTMVTWRGNAHKAQLTNGSGGVSGADKVALNDELKRINAKLQSLSEDYGSHQTWSESDRKKRAELNARKKEIMQKLGLKF